MKVFQEIIGKIDKIVIGFVVLVLLGSLYLVYTLGKSYSQKETVQSLDNALLLTRNLLEEEEQRAMSLSLLLSQDKTFLEAFYEHDRQKVFEIISYKIESLKKLQGYRFEVQIHDAKLHTYLRSWDYSIKDVPLASFREGLVLAKKNKKPIVSVEVGKRLNIKAISPIIKDLVFAGSIEVIEGFEHLREKLLKQGYSLFILLDKKYLSVATSLKNHPRVGKHFILVNSLYDKKIYNVLNNSDLSQLGDDGYFTKALYSFGYFEIKDLNNKRLGYCVVSLKNSKSLPESTHNKKNSQDTNITGVMIR